MITEDHPFVKRYVQNKLALMKIHEIFKEYTMTVRTAHTIPRRFTCYGSPFMKVDPVVALQTSGLVKSILSTETDIFAVNLTTGELTIITKATLIREGVIKVNRDVEVRLEALNPNDEVVASYSFKAENQNQMNAKYDSFRELCGDNQPIQVICTHPDGSQRGGIIRAGSAAGYMRRQLTSFFGG